MPPQGRLGDKARCPADVHGGPCCKPHVVVGPAVEGSPDVITNDKPSLRVGDPGKHAVCCGPQTWECKDGSGTVLINGKKAHRLHDATKHCGGLGLLIEGSDNVIVGG